MITFHQKDSTGLITLNRAEVRNALHPDMIKEIIQRLELLANDTRVKSLIITGSGSAFCAGADLNYLKTLQGFSVSDNKNDSELLLNFFRSIYHFPKPVIAAVNGPAIAGGCGLATVCDVIVADEQNARFGYSEVTIGFIPAIVALFLVKRLGEAHAKKLLLTAEVINAQEAYRIGLVDYIGTNVLDLSFDIASKFEKNSNESMQYTKQLVHSVSDINTDSLLELASIYNVLGRNTTGFKEGLSKILQKKGD